MPIYVYKCSDCGHSQDVLQKMSDPRLTVCPECGHSTYTKQVTSAGFQLKGSGWYVTDFRNNGSAPAGSAGSSGSSTSPGSTSNSGSSESSSSTTSTTPASTPAAPSAASS